MAHRGARRGPFDDAIAEAAELRHFDLDEIVHRHRSRIGRCPCEDQVAREQCDMSREIRDDVVDLKNHLADGALLDQLAILVGAQN
jgi:hypothetical protein